MQYKFLHGKMKLSARRYFFNFKKSFFGVFGFFILTALMTFYLNHNSQSLANVSWKMPWPSSVTTTVTSGAIRGNGTLHGDGFVGAGQSIDFGLPRGTPVLAPVNSTVIRSCDAGNNHRGIYLRADDGRAYSLIHVTASAEAVSANRRYLQGQQIGVVAADMPWNDCAKSEAPHLHMGFSALPFTIDGHTFQRDSTWGYTVRSTNGATPPPTASGRNIFRRVDNAWQLLPGAARDIGIGANGAAWVIGNNPVSGGYGIYRWDRHDWQPVDGGATDIAVDPSGNPWVVNSDHRIFRRVNNAWQAVPGAARDIGVGANGAVWVIGNNPVSGGYGIYQWNGRDWQPVDGGAVRIAVDPSGNPWVTNQ